MKRLVGMTLALVVFSGCGNENQLDLAENSVSYKVSYPSQTCTFKASVLPFGFSDHQNTGLDILGELSYMAFGGAQLKFNKISWSGVY